MHARVGMDISAEKHRLRRWRPAAPLAPCNSLSISDSTVIEAKTSDQGKRLLCSTQSAELGVGHLLLQSGPCGADVRLQAAEVVRVEEPCARRAPGPD